MEKSKICIGIIDIGSNSVRARAFADGKILYNGLYTTRLGEGLARGNSLTERSKARTIEAINLLKAALIDVRASEIYAFATEAIRSADNGAEFVKECLSATGVNIDVVRGDEEGELALLGAVGDSDGGVIDVGGASAEVSVVKNGRIIYSHSLPLGAVRLYGRCGEDEESLKSAVGERINEYGEIPRDVKFYAVGGTATTVAALDIGLCEYDADKVDGHILTIDSFERDYALIKSCDRSDRVNVLGINPKRADIIPCGAYMLLSIMRYAGIKEIIVKESDNLLGYLKKKVYGVSYEK